MCPPRKASRWIRIQVWVHYIGFFIQQNSLNFYYQTPMLCPNDIIMDALSWAYYISFCILHPFQCIISFYPSANLITISLLLPHLDRRKAWKRRCSSLFRVTQFAGGGVRFQPRQPASKPVLGIVSGQITTQLISLFQTLW